MKSNPPLSPVAQLAQLLIMGEGRLYINRVRSAMAEIPPDKFSAFLLVADKYLFKCLVYYIQLFRDDEAIQNSLNADDFALEALERIVLYLHFNFTIREKETEPIFTEYLFYLGQARLLALLLDTSYIKRDPQICINIMSVLDTKHIDMYVNQRTSVHEFVGQMIHAVPAEQLRSLFFHNPGFFGYLRLMFEHAEILAADRAVDWAESEIRALLDKLKPMVAEANQTQQLLAALKREHKAGAAVKPDRIRRILLGLRQMDHYQDAIEMLARQGAFESKAEQQIVQNLLINPHFRDILEDLPEFNPTELQWLQGNQIYF
ncbi:MAG: hypothetical protein KDK39_01920 [Leptospiraceae bacterium]|nr:hypothetical protein [Leptospiraceae bacterium]